MKSTPAALSPYRRFLLGGNSSPFDLSAQAARCAFIRLISSGVRLLRAIGNFKIGWRFFGFTNVEKLGIKRGNQLKLTL
jgi:hypothetical protein